MEIVRVTEGMRDLAVGRISQETWRSLCNRALRDTIERFEATGSPVITDGEQTKPSFATYPIQGLMTLAPDGVAIPFADGHVRQLPRLTGGPFRYQIYASTYLEDAGKHARMPVKQAVISASTLSLLYPQAGVSHTSSRERPQARGRSRRRTTKRAERTRHRPLSASTMGAPTMTLPSAARVAVRSEHQNFPRARSFTGRFSRQVVHQPVRIVSANSAGNPSRSICRASVSCS